MRTGILIAALTLAACGTKTPVEDTKAPVDVPITNETLMTDCEAGAAGSCAMLGVRYERGENVAHDADKAYEYYDKACRLGSSHGCYAKATFLLVERDNPIQAMSFLEYGCDQQKHGPSCVLLGDIARDGTVLPADEAEALRRYGMGCEIGYHSGCNAYIRQVWTASKQLVGLGDFVRFLERNCDAGHEMSCNEAADLYVMGAQWGGESLAPDHTKAEAMHAKLAQARRTRVAMDTVTSPPPSEMTVKDVSPTSEPPPFEPGYIVVSGRDGATIVVDGVDTGKTSPATVTILVGGRHTVQLRDKSGALSDAKQTWIDSAGRVELAFE